MFEQFLVALDQTGHEPVANELRCQLHIESLVAENLVPANVFNSKPIMGAIEHVIYSDDIQSGGLGGLTEHGKELFLVRSWPNCGRREVYDTANFTFQRYVEVYGLGRNAYGLASCDHNSCLHVSDWSNCAVHRVTLDGDNKAIHSRSWKVCGWLSGLSVNHRHNVMVTWGRKPAPSSDMKLIEYNTDGQLIRVINLFEDIIQYNTDVQQIVEIHPYKDIFRPEHVIHLIGLDANERYLVSHGYHGRGLHRVCEVDAGGRVLRCFGQRRGSSTGELNGPRNLAVDQSGYFFVADQNIDRIVILDSTLNWSCNLQIDGSVQKPFFHCTLTESAIV